MNNLLFYNIFLFLSGLLPPWTIVFLFSAVYGSNGADNYQELTKASPYRYYILLSGVSFAILLYIFDINYWKGYIATKLSLLLKGIVIIAILGSAFTFAKTIPAAPLAAIFITVK